MSLLQLNQIPLEVEALLTSEFAFVVSFGISVLKGAMLLRFIPSELVVPTALVLIVSSITNAIIIVLITVIGTTIGQFLLFPLFSTPVASFHLTSRELERWNGVYKLYKHGVCQAGLFPVASTLLQFIYQPAPGRFADGITVLMATVGYRPVRGLQSSGSRRIS